MLYYAECFYPKGGCTSIYATTTPLGVMAVKSDIFSDGTSDGAHRVDLFPSMESFRRYCSRYNKHTIVQLKNPKKSTAWLEKLLHNPFDENAYV